MSATILTTAPTTTATDRAPRPVTTPTDPDQLRSTLRSTGALVATIPPRDQRWEVVAPLVTAIATCVRGALGDPPSAPLPTDAPVIVRLRDLAAAARGLLADDVTIVDAEAAADVHAFASHVSGALA